jgi:hypothetical protein
MRTLPAPENGDEIVASSIAGPLLRAILSVCDARDARAIQYYKYIISIIRY